MQPVYQRQLAFVSILAGYLVVSAQSDSTEKYLNYTKSDSTRLTGFVIEDFAWRGSLNCSYKLMTPREGIARGVLVSLHGAGDNAANFSKIAARIDSSFLQHLVVQAPIEAPVYMKDRVTGQMKSFSGFSWVSNSIAPWTDGGAVLAVFLINRAIDKCLPHNPAHKRPLFVMGFRQGAGIAALWAAANKESVNGLVLVSGYAEPAIQTALQSRGLSLKDVPCLVLVGTEADDAIDSADLAVRIREIGGEPEVRYLERDSGFSEDDYRLMRTFIRERIDVEYGSTGE